MGSVKDLNVLSKPEQDKLGSGEFSFSNRFSVFDWGEMPDHIANKGSALAVMAAFNFELLREIGIRNHFRGLVSDGQLKMMSASIQNLTEPTNIMQVALTNVIRPNKTEEGYDYSFFKQNRGKMNNYLLPLEIIFRYGLPKGSSFFDRLDEAKVKGEDEVKKLLSSYGLKEEPKPGDMLPRAKLTYSTKLEESDRSLTEHDAFEISGLTEEEFRKIPELASRVGHLLTERGNKLGLIHYDGKVEMYYFGNSLFLCDVVGTFDENRFFMNGVQVSKEILRQIYKHEQPEWVKAVKEAKTEANSKGIADWKSLCQIQPKQLEELVPGALELVSHVYQAGTNFWTEKRLFDVPHLDSLIPQLRSLEQKYAD